MSRDTRALSDPALAQHFGEGPGPMLRLVAALAAKEYAPDVPASTSLDRLVIGSREGDQVEVGYRADLRTFHVRYWPRGGKPEAHRCELAAVESLIDSLILRLLLVARDD